MASLWASNIKKIISNMHIKSCVEISQTLQPHFISNTSCAAAPSAFHICPRDIVYALLSTWYITFAPTFNYLQSPSIPPLPNEATCPLASVPLSVPALSRKSTVVMLPPLCSSSLAVSSRKAETRFPPQHDNIPSP